MHIQIQNKCFERQNASFPDEGWFLERGIIPANLSSMCYQSSDKQQAKNSNLPCHLISLTI